jgi:elongation factor G
MREYSSERIRNVAVVGHGASGKTSLVDALAFVAGSSKRHGSVKDGTSLTDYTPDEIERNYSINLALAHAEWMETKVNLLDAPGYLDFIGDAFAALHAADGALIVVGATAGVEVGTELMWEEAARRGVPRMFFVSMMDKEHADFEKAYTDIREHLTPRVIPIEIPVGEGAEFHGIINLFSKRCHLYKAGTKTGEYDDVDIPAEYQEKFERYSQELIERIAETDDNLLERYLGGEEISREETLVAMKKGMQSGELFPLLCGAAELTYGTRALLSKFVELMPAPSDLPPVEAERWGTPEPVSVPRTNAAAFLARIFKTVSEPHVGDVSYFRILSGSLTNGAEVHNAPRDVSEKLNHLSITQGKDRTEVPILHAGDIGSVAKLKDTHTNDTLSSSALPAVVPKAPLPEPLIALAVEVHQHGEEDKLSTALQRLHEEDPTFHYEYNGELGQTIVRGRGERHLEVIVGRLKRKFGVTADLTRPRVAYRETFKGKGEAQGKHKKQTGGRGQYGDCWVRIAPLARGSGYEFENKITGGVIPGKYVPAVDKGIQEASTRGAIAGYPVVDFRAECFDGSYHDVDSSEMAFKMAGILAFRHAAERAKPVLLEPMLQVEVLTPAENLGEVMGDLSGRRGQILGTEPESRLTKIKVSIPEAEMYKYSTQLHSITHGRGTFHAESAGYQEAPPDVAQKVAAERAKEEEEKKK